MTANSLQIGLDEWLTANLATFLTNLRDEFSDDQEWKMPIVEDFVLVVAVRDMDDDGDGVFAISKAGTSNYRVQGLLSTVSI